MKINKNFSNLEIFNIAKGLLELDSEDLIFPIKINFYLQKNKKKFIELGKEIEESRTEIFQKYSDTFDVKDGSYHFPQEKIPEINLKITELLDLTQDVDFYQFDIDDFGDISLSSKQFSAIEFMIADEEEEMEAMD